MLPILALLLFQILPLLSQPTTCPVNLDLCQCTVVDRVFTLTCRGINQTYLNDRILLNVNLQNVGPIALTLRDFQDGMTARWPENSNVIRTQLQSLSIINANQIRVLPDWSSASALRECHLEGLPALSNVDFRGSLFPAGITVLRIVSTRITRLTEEMLTLRNLTTLELIGHARLEVIGRAFNQLNQLEVLKINGGLAKLGQNSLFGLHNVKELNLTWNGMTDLGNGVLTDLPNLVVLDLSHNDLTRTPDDLFSSPHLRFVAANHNEISTLPAGWIANTDVRRVDVTDNQLGTLPVPLSRNASRLNSLNFSGNRLTNIAAGVFSGLGSVIEVELQENQLEHLEGEVFGGLGGVRRLNVSYNQIERIGNGVFRDMRSLQVLDLRENRVLIVEDEAFGSMGNLTEFLFTGNTLTCSCSNLHMADYLTANHTLTSSDLYCVDPRTYQLHALSTLNATNCAPDRGNRAPFSTNLEGLLLAAAVLCGAVLFIGLGVACSCALHPRFRKYRHSYPSDYGLDNIDYRPGHDVQITEIKAESQTTIL
ncbi:leucine-rich repeat-containing protein 15-like [Paramacrobiotus metropolitanus]|uniref:leucine-rich repeat-containing protein 15-like n=1 Tax=Paramacrobiotus metropolitanus TaxID=2943436 RepID=UPI002445D45D|nr:leucine-rich repeat-containing protein 15-like [Paramacrobiotus metropolitanus]